MWYKKSHFRNLVDMHIPNGYGNLAAFDAEEYAENMQKAGVETAYVYASNCLGLCLYPSKIGYRHTVTVQRDIFGETVAALRKKGIGVVGYLNNWSSECAKMHPDWKIIAPGEDPFAPLRERTGVCCLHSPYRQYFLSLVYEMVSKYDIDGLWVDMVGEYTGVCACSHCVKAYKKKTGRDLPTTIGWSDKNFLDYLKFKADTLSEYAREIADAAHRAKPDISLSYQCAPWRAPLYNGVDNGYFAAMDYVSGDFYAEKNETDVVCRLLHSLTEKKPFEYMISRAPSLFWHTAIKSDSEILLQSYASLLCGGSFLFIDAIDPDGKMNPKLYEMMGRIKEKISPYFAYADCDDKIVRDVAVYLNFDSYMDMTSEGAPISSLNTVHGGKNEMLMNLNQALMNAHIDYDILTVKNLDALSEYKVIILPDVVRMTKKECDAIRAYVKAGGSVYATGNTSLYTPEGEGGEGYALSDLFGAQFVKHYDKNPVYISPTVHAEALFCPYTAKYPAMLPEGVPVVKRVGRDAKVLATVTYPFTDIRNTQSFSSALSSPPKEYTDLPAMVENPYGKGKCIYSVGAFEKSWEHYNRKIFTGVIRSLLQEQGPLLFESTASEVLEHAVKHSPDKNRYKICLLSYQTAETPIVMHDLTFSVRLPVVPKEVFTVSGTPVSYRVEDGRIFFALASLSLYDEVIVSY